MRADREFGFKQDSVSRERQQGVKEPILGFGLVSVLAVELQTDQGANTLNKRKTM